MKGTFGYFNLFLPNNAKLTLTLTYSGGSVKNLFVSSATRTRTVSTVNANISRHPMIECRNAVCPTCAFLAA